MANKKVTAKFNTGDFRYHVAPLINASGHAEVDMNEIDIEIGIAFSTTTLADGHIVPHVSSVDVKCDIDRHDIDLHISGNWISDIGSIFTVFFKGTVADAIEKTIKTTLKTTVPQFANQYIEKLDGVSHFPVAEDWYVDW